MELIPENYKKFAAPYIGQIVFEWDYPQHCTQPDLVVELTGEIIDRWLGCGRLRLKDTSMISDNECVDIYNLVYPKEKYSTEDTVEVTRYLLINRWMFDLEQAFLITDYLRLNGYCISTDEGILNNWVSLQSGDETPHIVGQ